jgi:hypothetical protein
MGLVRAGVLLDQEWCTLDSLFNNPAYDKSGFVARLARGEYELILHTPLSCGPDPFASVMTDCFNAYAASEIVFQGQLLPVHVLRYDGHGPSCRRAAR